MKAPKKYVYSGSGEVRFDAPDKEWLTHHYIALEKSTTQIAVELECTARTVRLWIHKLGVRVRQEVQIRDRHSKLMSGKGNPAWAGGRSSGYQKRLLWRNKVPYKCSWCGQLGKTRDSLYRSGIHDHQGDLHLHHKNHHRKDGRLENLCWLCYHCNLAEAHLWHLWKAGRLEIEVRADGLLLTFPHLRDR